MVYQLVGFHIMLAINGITTYEFIVKESNKVHERKNAAKRAAASSAASPKSPTSPKKYDLTSGDGDDVELSTL